MLQYQRPGLFGSAKPKINNCVFKKINTFDLETYRMTKEKCSEDAYVNDNTYVCNYHLAYFFKMEKSAINIQDAVGKEFLIMAGKSLIHQDATKRIFIPLKSNYKSVLQLETMRAEDKLVFYLIYQDDEEARALCRNFIDNPFNHMSIIYEETMEVLNKINPEHPCSQVRKESSARNLETQILDMPDIAPPFIANLIRVMVAPLDIMISSTTGTTRFILGPASTVMIDNEGLKAKTLYNDAVSKFDIIRMTGDKVMAIHNIFFSQEMVNNQNVLRRYERCNVTVQLMLGTYQT